MDQLRALLTSSGVDPSTLSPQGIQQLRTLIANNQNQLNGLGDGQAQPQQSMGEYQELQAQQAAIQAQLQMQAQMQAQQQAQQAKQQQAQSQAQAHDPRVQALYQQFQQLVVQQKDQLGELTKERLEALWQAFLERGLQQQQMQAAQLAEQQRAAPQQDPQQPQETPTGERKIMSVIGMPQVEETQLVRLLFDLLGKPEGIEIIHLTLLHDSVWFVVFCNEAYAEAAAKQLTALFRARSLACDALTLTPNQLPGPVIQQLTLQAQKISEARLQPSAQNPQRQEAAPGAQPASPANPSNPVKAQEPSDDGTDAVTTIKEIKQDVDNSNAVEALSRDLHAQMPPDGFIRIPGRGLIKKEEQVDRVWRETARGKYKKEEIEKVGLTIGLLPVVQIPGSDGVTKMWPAGRGKPVNKLMGALGMRVATAEPESEETQA